MGNGKDLQDMATSCKDLSNKSHCMKYVRSAPRTSRKMENTLAPSGHTKDHQRTRGADEIYCRRHPAVSQILITLEIVPSKKIKFLSLTIILFIIVCLTGEHLHRY